MKSFRHFAIVAILLWQLPRAFADDVITNFMSPIASYQYPEDFSGEILINGVVLSPFVSYEYQENFITEALINGGILSPIISYQYYEWPSNILSLQYSPTASYYYQFFGAPVLDIVQTNRIPTTAETTPAFLLLPSSSPSRLVAFHGGIFTTNLASVDPNQMTIVLTHGWNSSPNSWPSNMASMFRANDVTSPNIVAWDWTTVAGSSDEPGIPAEQTGEQGRELGEALQQKLGPNYSNKIQFIGHSLGTLVNASAANYLQGTNWVNEPFSSTPWPATNMLMTLFDEAEVATDVTNFQSDVAILLGLDGNPFAVRQSYDHPLPRQSAWAENYVSAFGLLQTNAANVILSDGFPTFNFDLADLFQALTDFHGYPMTWYEGTIGSDDFPMGFQWPLFWMQGNEAFADAPTNGSVYAQETGVPWYLIQTNWNWGTNYVTARFYSYQINFWSSAGDIPDDIVDASGYVQSQAIQYSENTAWQIVLKTANLVYGSNAQKQPLGVRASAETDNNNVPAYAWMQLLVPTNAVSLSFDYIIQGDWNDDSLATAFNGTNVLLIAGNEIETNTTFSSGPINVSAYAGQTNEFFVGIIGGTSTNAQLTVENLTFFISLAPTLQVQANGSNLIVSWPLSAQSFSLQTTTNLADPNAWDLVTNVPVIINFNNTVTNTMTGNQSFYRLITQ